MLQGAACFHWNGLVGGSNLGSDISMSITPTLSPKANVCRKMETNTLSLRGTFCLYLYSLAYSIEKLQWSLIISIQICDFSWNICFGFSGAQESVFTECLSVYAALERKLLDLFQQNTSTRQIYMDFFKTLWIAKISQILHVNFIKNSSNNADEIWVKISP